MSTAVYVSSTFRDLGDYRRAVHDVLRSIRCDVIRMEDYVARDQHTRAACEADVASCSVYVGIVAWRYGYVPEQDNLERKSITELEYRKARALGKTCLVFLLDDDAPWPASLMDTVVDPDDAGRRIRAFRNELKTRASGYFRSAEDLAKQVVAAIYQDEATKRVRTFDLEAIDAIRSGPNLGASYLPNIQERITSANDTDVAELSLGPVPWWNTRLHLLAALAEEFTQIRQLAFLDPAGYFILICAPHDLRRELARHTPALEIAYLQSRARAVSGTVDEILQAYPRVVTESFTDRLEEDVKVDVDPVMLKVLLGPERIGDVVAVTGQPRNVLQYEIAKCRSEYVALVRNGQLEGVVDRAELTGRIATQVLQQALG